MSVAQDNFPVFALIASEQNNNQKKKEEREAVSAEFKALQKF